MSNFKLIRHGDVWIIAKDNFDVVHKGGIDIDYATYKLLKDNPAEIDKHFEVVNGKPIHIAKSNNNAQD